MFETLSRAVAGRAGIIAEVTLSYIAFETWSGKPEPGTVHPALTAVLLVWWPNNVKCPTGVT